MNKHIISKGNIDSNQADSQIFPAIFPSMIALKDFLKVLENSHISHDIKKRIDELFRLSMKYEEESLSLIRLVPTEGLMSHGAKILMTTVMNERYLHAPSENYAKAIRYPDIHLLQEVYDICRKALNECLKANFVNIDPISGLQVMQLSLTAFAQSGELILSLNPDAGGHESTQFIAENIGRYVEHLPFDFDNHIINVRKLDRSKNPSLIYIDHSNILRPHNLTEIKRVYPNALVCFDISQVFASIAGGIFPNPLYEGADVVVGSTHKSLNGPQKAILATNNQKYYDRFQEIASHFISNNHPGDIAALAMTLLEFQAFGNDYAKQMVNNANALAKSLIEHNLPVYGITSAGQYTYSPHVWIDCDKVGYKAEEMTKKLYEDFGIVVNTLFLPKGGKNGQGAKGLRLGTTEITRIGMKEEHMQTIAELISKAFTESEDIIDKKKIANDLRLRFPFIHYCVQYSGFSKNLEATPEKIKKFTLPSKTPAIALFGPSGSGKNTLIKHLMNTGHYVQVPIITTRQARGIESDRTFVTLDIFQKLLNEGKIVYASEHYGYWHGVEKEVFEQLANSWKCLILDPNQFYRLDMLREIFAHGGLKVVAILPDTVDGIKSMSDEDIDRIYRPRIQSRSGVTAEEIQLRVSEAIKTIRTCGDRINEFDIIFVNIPGRNLADRYSEFVQLVETAFNESSKEINTEADYPEEIRNALAFFSSCKLNYAIFAGFASHLLTNVSTSPDIDVLVESEDDCLFISRLFHEKYGWILTKEHCYSDGRLNIVLEKDGSSVDLVFSPHAVTHFLKGDFISSQSTCDCSVNVLGPEALLLSKISQITSLERSMSKKERDTLVINRLRAMSNLDKLRYLASVLGREYWLKGMY